MKRHHGRGNSYKGKHLNWGWLPVKYLGLYLAIGVKVNAADGYILLSQVHHALVHVLKSRVAHGQALGVPTNQGCPLTLEISGKVRTEKQGSIDQMRQCWEDRDEALSPLGSDRSCRLS